MIGVVTPNLCITFLVWQQAHRNDEHGSQLWLLRLIIDDSTFNLVLRARLAGVPWDVTWDDTCESPEITLLDDDSSAAVFCCDD